jgi:hypothetical protein
MLRKVQIMYINNHLEIILVRRYEHVDHLSMFADTEFQSELSFSMCVFPPFPRSREVKRSPQNMHEGYAKSLANFGNNRPYFSALVILRVRSGKKGERRRIERWSERDLFPLTEKAQV